MKSHRWLLCLSALLLVSAHAAEFTPVYRVPGWQAPPGSVKDWADRCTDFTVNGWGFKDPDNAVKLIGLFSDPAIYLEFAQRSLDPESYARIVDTLLDPATAKNYLEWSDPVIYAKWTAAMMDPTFYLKVMRPMLDPGTYLRWMVAPMDPRWWSVGMQTMNPGVWMKWALAPVNPKVMAPLAKAADPNTGLKWSQAAADPANYRYWAFFPAVTSGQAAIPGTDAAPASPFGWFLPYGLPPTGAGSKAAEEPAKAP